MCLPLNDLDQQAATARKAGSADTIDQHKTGQRNEIRGRRTVGVGGSGLWVCADVGDRLAQATEVERCQDGCVSTALSAEGGQR